MSDYKIKIGDVVRVNFNGAMTTLCLKAEVKYIPYATGDSWIFEDLSDGSVHYVSEGCTVSKFPPSDDLPF